MKKYNLKDMVRGWFVGDFEPTVYKTKECEVGYRYYKAGDQEQPHIHKVAIELTLVTSGIVNFNGVDYHEGDIVMIEPGEISDFKAITDATNIIVKIPSVKGDKYLVEEK